MDKLGIKNIFAHLASTGTPPTDMEIAREALPMFSVAVDSWIERLATEYLDGLCRENSHYKLVLAPYGGGKTHFLMSVGAKALQCEYAVAYVPCVPDKKGAPARVDNPLGLYTEFINKIELPGGQGQGLPALLKAVIEKKRKEIEAAGAHSPDQAFEAYLDDLRDTFREGTFGPFARLAAVALRARWSGQRSNTSDAAERWLEGGIDASTKDDLKELRLARVPSAERGKLGRQLLMAAIKFTKEAGCNGTVLLLDELETLFTARGKALNAVLAAMRVLIDQNDGIRGGIPLLCLFAAVPDVLEQLSRYPALEQRLAVQGGTFHEGNDYAPQLSLEHLDMESLVLLGDIGIRLIALGSIACDVEFDVKMQSANAQLLAKVASARSLDVNARRLFVKTWAGLLRLQANDGQRQFAEDELAQRYSGAFEDLRKADNESDEP